MWHRCDGKNIPAGWLENLIWQSCTDFIMNPGTTLKELAKSLEEKNSLEKEYNLILKNLSEKEQEKEKILDLYRKNLISLKDAENQLAKIKSETDILENMLKQKEAQLNNERAIIGELDMVENLLKTLRERIQGEVSFDIKREIVKALVKEIIVTTQTKDGQKNAIITIYFSFYPGVNVTVPATVTGESSSGCHWG